MGICRRLRRRLEAQYLAVGAIALSSHQDSLREAGAWRPCHTRVRSGAGCSRPTDGVVATS
jgi:hypothetical protein